MFGDLLADLAARAGLDFAEQEQLRRTGNQMELVSASVASLYSQANLFTGDNIFRGNLHSADGIYMDNGEVSDPHDASTNILKVSANAVDLPYPLNSEVLIGAGAPSGKMANVLANATDGINLTSLNIRHDGLIELYGQLYFLNGGNGTLGGADLNNHNISSHTELSQPTDTAISFTPGRDNGSMIMLPITDNSFWGIISYRTSVPDCVKLTGLGNLDVMTGVLTGTTGLASDVTISAHTDGKIYVENRRGGARSWRALLI